MSSEGALSKSLSLDYVAIDNDSSDEDEVDRSDQNFPELQEYLNKWTNYIHGWQRRWIVLKDGTLSYYKSESETRYGCRGAISLFQARIKAHEFDDCRFDVSVNDCAWYLRADSPEGKQRWLRILDVFKATDSGYGSQNNLKRHGSLVSVRSFSPSITYVTSLQKNKVTVSGIKEKVAELETLKELLCTQLENLLTQCEDNLPTSDNAGESNLVNPRCQIITIRTTINSVLEGIKYCIEMYGNGKDSLLEVLNVETEKRKIIEELYRNVLSRCDVTDLQTEHSRELYPKDNTFDAVDEAHNDDIDTSDSCEIVQNAQTEITQSVTDDNPLLMHRLWPEIQTITNEQVQFARMGLGEDGWQLFAEEGEMKMYRREEEQNGVVMDPLKACHFVHGFTAHEICNYFFKPEFRYEWETTLESNGMIVLETISDNAIIFHQIHKRIWPVAQRDAVFWSHLSQVPLEPTDDKSIHDAWVVVNHSTSMPSHPIRGSKFVRLFMTVSLFCQTVILLHKPIDKLTRNDIACKITYCSVVDPGGWTPSAALRIVYKREYPRFLRKFTAYVTNKTKDTPIMF